MDSHRPLMILFENVDTMDEPGGKEGGGSALDLFLADRGLDLNLKSFVFHGTFKRQRIKERLTRRLRGPSYDDGRP